MAVEHVTKSLPDFPPLDTLALVAEAADLDEDLATAERRVRLAASRYEAFVEKRIAELLADIGEVIDGARRDPESYRSSIDVLIDEAERAERAHGRQMRHRRKLPGKVMRLLETAGPGRQALGKLASRELTRLAERLMAALQEIRWMLMAARADAERDSPAPVASTPEELRSLLHQPG